ncbi:hypothetical protein B0H14DRAFT_3428627 [Mycena olivaceomarginata]|nr:hypothetical protein B0H14DRAFT_3428627 [Mycena olivaceomarginata]
MPFALSLLVLLLCGLPISGADVGADTGASSSSVDNALGMILDAGSINTLLFGPLQQIIEPTSPASDPIPSAPSGDQGFLYYYSLQLPSSQPVADTVTDIQTQTQTLTEPPTTTTATTTITVSAAPSTITDVVTVFVSTSSSPASSPPSSSAPLTSTTTAPNAKATLTRAPNANTTSTTIANLTMFSALVTGIPASATTGPKGSTSTSVDSLAPAFLPMPYQQRCTSRLKQSCTPKTPSTPAPSPSVGPSSTLRPLNIADAQAVLVYLQRVLSIGLSTGSKPGKLPGLFGGRPSCSGGDAATDCFSTRLMWRQDGMGELYLYAPKDKQTRALCRDPQSECNADYGFSIGRKSFKWRAGGWTTVTQIVRMNTPGKQDGEFRVDVYYRGAGPNAAKSASASAVRVDHVNFDFLTTMGTTMIRWDWGELETLLPGLLDPRMMAETPFLLPVPPTATSALQETTTLPNDTPREWVIQLAPTQTDLGAGLLAETATTTTTVTTTVLVGTTLLPVSDQAAVQAEPCRVRRDFLQHVLWGSHNGL